MWRRYRRYHKDEAMTRAQFKKLEDGSCFGEVPGLAGVWAKRCRAVLQEVLEEWLVLKIRDGDAIPRLGRGILALVS
jgi:hypothetical protein